jgi:hypothetical protein
MQMPSGKPCNDHGLDGDKACGIETGNLHFERLLITLQSTLSADNMLSD